MKQILIIVILGTLVLNVFGQKVYKEYYRSGVVRAEYQINSSSGVRDGYYKEFDENGRMLVECNYKDNLKNGQYSEWVVVDNKRLLMKKSKYKDDKEIEGSHWSFIEIIGDPNYDDYSKDPFLKSKAVTDNIYEVDPTIIGTVYWEKRSYIQTYYFSIEKNESWLISDYQVKDSKVYYYVKSYGTAPAEYTKMNRKISKTEFCCNSQPCVIIDWNKLAAGPEVLDVPSAKTNGDLASTETLPSKTELEILKELYSKVDAENAQLKQKNQNLNSEKEALNDQITKLKKSASESEVQLNELKNKNQKLSAELDTKKMELEQKDEMIQVLEKEKSDIKDSKEQAAVTAKSNIPVITELRGKYQIGVLEYCQSIILGGIDGHYTKAQIEKAIAVIDILLNYTDANQRIEEYDTILLSGTSPDVVVNQIWMNGKNWYEMKKK
jgi:hypothetical protein